MWPADILVATGVTGNSVALTHIRMRGSIYACASYDPATVFPRNMRRCQEKLSLERRHAQTINCSEPAKWSRANTTTYIRTFERENCQAISQETRHKTHTKPIQDNLTRFCTEIFHENSFRALDNLTGFQNIHVLP